MVKQISIIFISLVLLSASLTAQVVINEFVSSNITGITDEDNENSDWIELYNSSDQSVNLSGYKLADNQNDSTGWAFPDISIAAHSYLIVFASGKDKDNFSPKYQTIIKQGDNWKYLVPTDYLDANWRNSDFDDTSWLIGPSGFGYGDDDDATALSNIYVVLLRKEFTIDDVNSINKMLFHVDYDDGFIAFINGVEVAMGGISEYSDDYSVVTASSHEAVMYSGGTPEEFDLSSSIYLLKNGKNVISIQGHNTDLSSSDFSLIPFLTLSSSKFTTNDAVSFISIETGNLHTNFKISKDGEALYFYNKEGQLIDSTKSVALGDDISYGRYPDGGSQWYYFNQSTPGNSNENPLDSIISDSVIFSENAGFYKVPFNLTLQTTSSKAGEIRYTTDGSLPTHYSGLYSMPITVSTTTVVRAAYFSSDSSSNPITSRMYIFDESNGLPVVSISSDPYNFFNWDEGILVLGPNAETSNPYYGANFWMDWEKPVNFEFFDQQGVLQVNQDAGIKVAGNWSRANAQKSMALYARKSYGKGSFAYKFFNDRDNDTFESILLRNSGNDWSYTMFRDGLISEIARDMDMERLAYQPAKVYLNGDYWGILNLREKPSDHYFEENFSVDENNLNLLEGSGDVIYGKNSGYNKLKNFLNTKSLSIEDNYHQVSEMMNLSCFIDYEILEIYVDNGDWPGNNIKYWNTNDSLSRWRWLIFDADFGFDLYGSNGNTLQFATASNGPSWPNPPWSTLLLRKLLANQEFKYSFVNRLSDCMNSNLLYEKLLYKVDSIQNLLIPEIENHLDRWGFSYDGWINEVNRIETFISGRRSNMRSYMRSYFGFSTDHLITLALSDEHAGRININTITPNNYPFQGYYFGEVPITIKAIPNPGYRFVHWEGGSTSTDLALTINLTSNLTYTAVFEVSVENEQDIVINEINYKSSDSFNPGDWIELYNNGKQSVDLSNWVLKDQDPEIGFIFPQGLILYPDEYLVIAENLTKFATAFPLVKNVTGEFSFGLSSSGDVIYLYDNEGDFIDMVNYGVQSPWPVDPCGLGPTLELKQPALDNEQAANWLAGQNGGTPGKKNSVNVTVGALTVSSVKASCFPTIFSDYVTLQFFAQKEGKYSVQIIDLHGRIQDRIEGYADSVGAISLDLFTDSGQFSPGVYLVRVQTGGSLQTVKVIKQ